MFVCAWGADRSARRRGHGDCGRPARLACRRVEARRHAVDYLRGLLAEVERKNGWQLAEQAGYAHPRGIQRVLDRYAWDAEAVRDDLRRWVVAELGDPCGVLVVDETGFPKQGRHSAGVARQYSGTLGKIANCQVGVFLGYATCRGHVGLDRALFIPREWFADRDRCRRAGIPDDRDRYDGACVPLRPALREGWVHAVLLRRHPERVDELAYYRVYAPVATPLPEVIRAAGARWTIDDLFKLAKGQVGLDHYEVRSWQGWHRHITLALLALAALTIGARKKGGRRAPATSRSPSRRSAGCSSGSSGPPRARPTRSSPGPAGAGTIRKSPTSVTAIAA